MSKCCISGKLPLSSCILFKNPKWFLENKNPVYVFCNCGTWRWKGTSDKTGKLKLSLLTTVQWSAFKFEAGEGLTESDLQTYKPKIFTNYWLCFISSISIFSSTADMRRMGSIKRFSSTPPKIFITKTLMLKSEDNLEHEMLRDQVSQSLWEEPLRRLGLLSRMHPWSLLQTQTQVRSIQQVSIT